MTHLFVIVERYWLMLLLLFERCWLLLLLLLLFATHLFVVVEGWRLGQMAPFQVEEEPAGNLERHQDKNRQKEETPLFLSHTQAHKQGHVSPFSASTAPRSGALTSIPPPLPPSSQSSKINEAPVSVDNSIRNRFATIQEVYGTIPMSSYPRLFKESNCTISL